MLLSYRVSSSNWKADRSLAVDFHVLKRKTSLKDVSKLCHSHVDNLCSEEINPPFTRLLQVKGLSCDPRLWFRTRSPRSSPPIDSISLGFWYETTAASQNEAFLCLLVQNYPR